MDNSTQRAITGFQGSWRYLSNFYERPFSLWGVTWPTAEHAYQGAKAYADTGDSYMRIRLARTPGEAKRLGRKVPLPDWWEARKVRVMFEVVSAKFEDPELASWLDSTGTSLLVEGNNWHDQFWGSCACSEHLRTPGRNVLGHVLMTVRAGL